MWLRDLISSVASDAGDRCVRGKYELACTLAKVGLDPGVIASILWKLELAEEERNLEPSDYHFNADVYDLDIGTVVEGEDGIAGKDVFRPTTNVTTVDKGFSTGVVPVLLLELVAIQTPKRRSGEVRIHHQVQEKLHNSVSGATPMNVSEVRTVHYTSKQPFCQGQNCAIVSVKGGLMEYIEATLWLIADLWMLWLWGLIIVAGKCEKHKKRLQDLEDQSGTSRLDVAYYILLVLCSIATCVWLGR